MRYQVTHTTYYQYRDTVALSYNEVRMQPRACPNQILLNSHLEISPQPCDSQSRVDFFGNQVTWFSIREPHKHFKVAVSSEVEIFTQTPQTSFQHTMSWEAVKATIWNDNAEPVLNARQYALDSPFIAATSELARYAQPSFKPGLALTAVVHNLMQRIHHDFIFDPEFTTLSTPLASVLEHRRGVCQDFAHLAIGCIRSMGLAARYVSGYIETLPPPGQAKLVGADASHAWFSVYLPELGWLDFDPTNNQLPNGKHIVVAWGRDYSDVAPLKGVVFGGQNHDLRVEVEVCNLGNS